MLCVRVCRLILLKVHTHSGEKIDVLPNICWADVESEEI